MKRFYFFYVLVLFHISISSAKEFTQTTKINANPNSAIRKWIAKIRENPKKALYRFNLGVAYHKQKKYKKALRQYKKAISLKSRLTPICRYYRAKIFKSVRRSDLAKKEISKVNLKTVPSTLKRNVLLFKNTLFAEDVHDSIDEDDQSKKTAKEQRLFLSLNLNRGSNSNPLFTSETSSSSTESDTQTRATGNLSYLAAIDELYDWKIKYNYSQTMYKENNDAESSYHSVSLPFAFYQSKYRWTLQPDFISDTYTGEDFSENIGGTIEGTYKSGATYWSISYQYLKANVKNEDFEYLDGYTQSTRGSVQNRWASSQLTSSLTFNQYSYQDTDDLASSYDSLSIDLNYTHYWGRWEFNSGLYLESRKYTLATNDSEARADIKSTISLQIIYNYSQNFSLYGDLSKTKNRSNFDSTDNDRTYDQKIALVGLSLYY